MTQYRFQFQSTTIKYKIYRREVIKKKKVYQPFIMQSIHRQLNHVSTFMNCVWIHAVFKVQFETLHLILSALTSGSSSSSSSSSLLSSSSLSFCKSSSSSTSRYFSISLRNMMNKIKGKKRTEEKKRKRQEQLSPPTTGPWWRQKRQIH